MLRRAIIAICLCLTVGLLPACSALRVGYSTAPSLAFWWLDRYADFNGAQSEKVHAAIARWFTWHRHEQVPEYVQLLVRAQAEVVTDTTPARVCEWQSELIRRADVAYESALPAAAELVPTLSAEQITHIEQRYAKNNAEYTDDYLQRDPADRAEATLKRALERIEILYGSLDKAQRSRLVAALARSPFDPELWLAERRARQRDALDLLRELTRGPLPREQVQAALRAYGQRIEHSPREAYQRYSERLSDYNCALVSALHNGTTIAQRRHAAKVLAGWEGDLRSIAARPDPAQE